MPEALAIGLLVTGIVGGLFILGAASNEIVLMLRSLVKANWRLAHWQEVLMAQVDDLKAAVQAVSDGVGSIDTKLDEVLASVDAVIALLQGGPVNDPVIAQAIADLQAVATRAGAVQAEAQGIKDAADAAAGA